MKSVVVVESPAKAKTINRYLGNDYIVLASYGHIRDLPSKNGSVDPDHDFKMVWEMQDRAKNKVNEILKAVKGADQLLLATDPDREGEAISWHVQQVLNEKKALVGKEVKRIVFHEITKGAIQNAIQHPREIDKKLVSAYLARRALDYLVGFTLSPVLWRKLPGARSAGRVQSVALRLIVEREQEIEAFITQEYWSIEAALLNAAGQAYKARLTHLHGKKLDKLALKTEVDAQAACAAIRSRSFLIGEVEKKQVKRNPAAPFTTSTLQQEAARKLGFSASRTMQVAQRLYEGVEIQGGLTGLITYMRTDSIAISNEAITEMRQHIDSVYGSKYLPSSPRVFKSKSKNAQEAHEAVRPTSVLRRPEDVRAYLDDSHYKLYELIWKRTVASQMETALFDQVGVDILSEDRQVILRATGSTMTFDGFMRLYLEGKDDASGDEDEERLLPPLTEGEAAPIQQVTPNQHFTQPPPRYSEASLVKKLEELGIGRPSTYASIIQVLQDRDYVQLEKRQFIPAERGRLVTSFLTNFFKRYVEYDFTANLEEQLDDISNGAVAWKEVLTQFWGSFKQTTDSTQSLTMTEVIDSLEKDLSHHLFHGDEASRVCPQCQKGRLSLKLSRYGAFLGCSDYPECKYTKPLSGDTPEGEGDEPPIVQDEPKVIGHDPDTGEEITLRKGPYGPYLQWGEAKASPDKEKQKKGKASAGKPKRVALPAGFNPESVTFETAMALKALPKTVGPHPDTGEIMSISIGRFGPYVKCGSTFASIPKSEDMFAITLERAAELVTQKQNKPASGRSFGRKKANKSE
ncbi:type I DNA topoisomerase [Candidatus Odyssella thessalonicensis]|uniref:type I DNA topoisomerase n=1 Tax=Candidatus Odyssella thessalonicensis TaxID=84647 RepID=UPI000225B1E6|nr:type I DNA topoisomerase [Candidatus Odyssella thessalonicensis]